MVDQVNIDTQVRLPAKQPARAGEPQQGTAVPQKPAGPTIQSGEASRRVLQPKQSLQQAQLGINHQQHPPVAHARSDTHRRARAEPIPRHRKPPATLLGPS